MALTRFVALSFSLEVQQSRPARLVALRNEKNASAKATILVQEQNQSRVNKALVWPIWH